MRLPLSKIEFPEKLYSLTVFTYVALVSLFVPTFYKLFSYGWKQADYSHGPLVLIVFFWLLWQKRESFVLHVDECFNIFFLGFLIFGLMMYFFGATQRTLLLESLSIVPVLIGITGFLYGRQAVRLILFPSSFLIFLVPPPLFMIDLATSPLKYFVAAASERILYLAGYAINRSGVILFIGDYSIVVGDACSGLRSLISLMAVGALYIHLQGSSALRRSVLFVSIIPVSVVANIIRLIFLSLITFHYGESAGQGFFHNFSGMLVFVVALAGLISIDFMTVKISGRQALK